MAGQVVKRSLPVVEPPAPATGGRILTPAGELAQLVSSEAFRHLAYIEFKLGFPPRGNHFHRKKEEYVYVIQGRLEVVSIDLDSHEQSIYILEAGDLLLSPPNNAHVYKALEYTHALEFAPQAFDPEDTIKYQVA